jgi:hypothetical protein
MREHTFLWVRIRRAVGHALAIPPSLQLTPEDEQLLARIAAMIVRRGLGAPAIMLLDTVRPLNFVASQFLVFLGPFATVLLKPADYDRFVALLENRQGVDMLIKAITDEADRNPSGLGGKAASPPGS